MISCVIVATLTNQKLHHWNTLGIFAKLISTVTFQLCGQHGG